MPGLHEGTRASSLVDPVVSREVGLYWGESEVVMPMARAFVEIGRDLNKSGELRRRLMGNQLTASSEQPGRGERAAQSPRLKHNPEKWTPVLGKDQTPTNRSRFWRGRSVQR